MTNIFRRVGVLAGVLGLTALAGVMPAGAAPAGRPIKLVTIVDNSAKAQYPSVRVGALAAAREVNDAGGVKGRPIEIVVCATQSNVNVAEKCARDASADKDVLGIIGGQELLGGGFVPILQQGGLRMYSPYPASQPYLASKISFPIIPGSTGSVLGAVGIHPFVLKEKTYCLLVGDVPTARGLEVLENNVLKAIGAPPITRTFYIDLTTADYGAEIAAISGMDGCMVALPEANGQRFVKQARQQGFRGTFSASGVTFSAQSLKAIGSAAEGMYISNQYRRGGAGDARIAAAMDKVDPKASKDDLAITAYFGVKMFAQVASRASGLDRAALARESSTLTTFDTMGMTPALDFTKRSTVAGGAFPRMFNTSVYFTQWKNGKFREVLPGFVDGFTGAVRK